MEVDVVVLKISLIYYILSAILLITLGIVHIMGKRLVLSLSLSGMYCYINVVFSYLKIFNNKFNYKEQINYLVVLIVLFIFLLFLSKNRYIITNMRFDDIKGMKMGDLRVTEEANHICIYDYMRITSYSTNIIKVNVESKDRKSKFLSLFELANRPVLNKRTEFPWGGIFTMLFGLMLLIYQVRMYIQLGSN